MESVMAAPQIVANMIASLNLFRTLDDSRRREEDRRKRQQEDKDTEDKR
jgi:hypothetical protein